jgi:bacteriocin-like protein
MGAGMVLAPDKQGNDMTKLNNDIRELNINELDAVSGGGDIIEGVKSTIFELGVAVKVGENLGLMVLVAAAGAGR